MLIQQKKNLLGIRILPFVTITLILVSCSSSQIEPFIHRGYLGWMIDMSRTKNMEDWPSVKLDSALLNDYIETLDFLELSGMNEITPWGLFTNKYWEPKVENTIDSHRESMVRKIIDLAHQRNIKVMCGMGVYSWGFDKILNENPEIGCECNPEVMDLTVAMSWEWQKKVLDYVMDNFDFDGMSLQSADRGGCFCGESEKYAELEYHAILNQKSVEYIRSKKKDFVIGICGWGMNFSNPQDLEHIVAMTKNVDYLIDVGETALFPGKSYREKLIAAIAPCNYGSTAIPNIEPIQAIPRDFYFIPTVHNTGQRLINLYKDGGRACETYARTRGNPGDKVTVEVIAQLLSDPNKEINIALAEVLTEMYIPENDGALATLLEIYNKAENAFFTNYPKNNNNGQYHDIILLMPRNQKEPSSRYIEYMTPDARRKYAQTMESLNAQASQLVNQVGDQQNLELLLRCLSNAYNESRKLAQ